MTIELHPNACCCRVCTCLCMCRCPCMFEYVQVHMHVCICAGAHACLCICLLGGQRLISGVAVIYVRLCMWKVSMHVRVCGGACAYACLCMCLLRGQRLMSVSSSVFSTLLSSLLFRDMVSPGWPVTHRGSPTCAFSALELKTCATTPNILYLKIWNKAQAGLEFMTFLLLPKCWDCIMTRNGIDSLGMGGFHLYFGRVLLFFFKIYFMDISTL